MDKIYDMEEHINLIILYILLQEVTFHHILFFKHDLGHLTLVCITHQWL